MKDEKTKTKFPTPLIVHWPSGPVECCEEHAKGLIAVGNHLGSHIVARDTFKLGYLDRNEEVEEKDREIERLREMNDEYANIAFDGAQEIKQKDAQLKEMAELLKRSHCPNKHINQAHQRRCDFCKSRKQALSKLK